MISAGTVRVKAEFGQRTLGWVEPTPAGNYGFHYISGIDVLSSGGSSWVHDEDTLVAPSTPDEVLRAHIWTMQQEKAALEAKLAGVVGDLDACRRTIRILGASS